MNPAALRANARWLKPGATIICDGDTFNDRSVERAGFRTFDPVTEMNLQDYNVVFPHMTSMTREAVATVGLDPKAAYPNARICSRWASALASAAVRWTMPSTFHSPRSSRRKPAIAQADTKVLARKRSMDYGVQHPRVSPTPTR